MTLNTELLSRAADQARGLCIDAVHASQSGHLGLPLGCAEMGAVLYGYALKHNPDKPRWIGRDYFILSAGHGSMFLYSWLNLSGYDLPMSEIERFRQLHSKTPGHPEFFETPGVECTTGPLGQGVANAVGVAMAAKMAAARFNTDAHKIFDQHIFCLAGDGCLQEGVSAEASAFAVRLRRSGDFGNAFPDQSVGDDHLRFPVVALFRDVERVEKRLHIVALNFLDVESVSAKTHPGVLALRHLRHGVERDRVRVVDED